MKKLKIFSAIDYILLFCVLCLTVIGIVFIYSAAIDRNGVLTNQNYVKQIFWGITGLIMMLFFPAMITERLNVLFSGLLLWHALFFCIRQNTENM